jgi:inosose dehydratase
MPVELAGAPVSWGVDFAGAPGNPAPDEVLDGIAAAGLRAMELGPPGYLPASGAMLRTRGLRSVGTFVFEGFHDRGARAAVLAATQAALDSLARHGGRVLVLIDRPAGVRADTAGRRDDAPAAARDEWRAMTETLRRAAALARDRGVAPVVHPHAGSRIEFAGEIARLLDDVPADELGLCLDTGHALFAGDDPCALLRRHRDRVAHLHVKDVDPGRLAAARAARHGFWTAMAAGAFCPVGDGALELPALARTLAAIGYTGVATIEQDRRPGSPGTPEADLRRNVARLLEAGIGRAEAQRGSTVTGSESSPRTSPDGMRTGAPSGS